MAFTNKAAWLCAKGSKLQVGAADLVLPGPDEILLANHAWAINPIDWKMQDMGLHIDTFPVIMGNDVAGVVVAVGDDVSTVEVGTRIIAHSIGMSMKKTSHCGFQLYTIVAARYALPIPDSLPFEQAVKLPLAVLTASTGLYNSDHLKLALPTLDAVPTGKTLIVWGGSSSVGLIAIQLARASGLNVVTTVSKHNEDLVRRLGATKIYDRNSPEVVAEMVADLRGKDVIGAFDAIGQAQATMNVAQILSELGGGRLASVFNRFDGIPTTVEPSFIFAPSIFLREPAVGEAVWNNFLPAALQRGLIKPVLKTLIAGRGLEDIQKGIDRLRNGVSAAKVVVLANPLPQPLSASK